MEGFALGVFEFSLGRACGGKCDRSLVSPRGSHYPFADEEQAMTVFCRFDRFGCDDRDIVLTFEVRYRALIGCIIIVERGFGGGVFPVPRGVWNLFDGSLNEAVRVHHDMAEWIGETQVVYKPSDYIFSDEGDLLLGS
ncbi:hypothetical protein M514_27883 [Trichuris suis]|nr:hypothetical protein M514_27883 [Trichuris suis]